MQPSADCSAPVRHHSTSDGRHILHKLIDGKVLASTLLHYLTALRQLSTEISTKSHNYNRSVAKKINKYASRRGWTRLILDCIAPPALNQALLKQSLQPVLLSTL